MKRVLIIAIIVAVVIAVALAVILLPKMNKELEPAKGPGYDLFAAETEMVEIDGEKITWDEYYTWLNYCKNTYEQNYGEITDWTATDPNGETYYDAVKDYTLYIIKVYKALDKYAAENGIELTEEELAEIKGSWDEMAQMGDGEFSVFEYMKELFGTREMYEYLSEMSVLYSKTLESIYGEGAKDVPDSDVRDYFADSEYTFTYHILAKTTDEDNKPLPADQIAAKKALAEENLAKIDAFEGTNEEKKDFFISLVKEYSDDPGGMDGYVFLPGYMVEEFEQAAWELSEYEHSGIVESEFGYHIILRLPLEPDKVPLDYAQMGYSTTLRQLAADAVFYATTETWAEELSVSTAKDYDGLNVAEGFVG